MKWFKKLAEKIYYKAYPERINDHDIATSPIEPLRVTRYDLKCIDLVAEEMIPREMTYCINEAQEEEFINYLKHSLFSKFEPELIKYMKIKRDRITSERALYTYRARIKFFVDDREEV